MKKKMIKTGLMALLLLTLLTSAVTASAEENGYWTMKTDESGMPVMIYTYTEPVEWTIDEQSGYGHCGSADASQISQSEQADTYLSADADTNVQAAANTAVPSAPYKTFLGTTFLLPILSVLFGMAVIIFIFKKFIHRKSRIIIKIT